MGYSPRGRKESDTTERLPFFFFFFLVLVFSQASHLALSPPPPLNLSQKPPLGCVRTT